MVQISSDAALSSLTDWWEDMGVPADEVALRALKKKIVDQSAANRQAPQSALTASPVNTPTSERRQRKSKNKPVEAWIEEASHLAAAAKTLDELKTAIEEFEGCPLKALCEKTVVFDGTRGAEVMVLGEGPGGQEDRTGLPFVGKAGQLLDKMLAAIKLDRKTNTFISNVNYWRPPGNRNPETDELAVCRPFVNRMVDLAQPKIIMAMGGVAAKTLLNTKTGIMRLRGKEHMFDTPGGSEVPIIPMLHPAFLLRRPEDKSRAWRDLLLLQERLEEMGVEV